MAVPFRFLTEAYQPAVRLRVQMQPSSKHGHSSYQKYAPTEAHISLYKIYGNTLYAQLDQGGQSVFTVELVPGGGLKINGDSYITE